MTGQRTGPLTWPAVFPKQCAIIINPTAAVVQREIQGYKGLRGDFLSFLDSDDLWVKEKLSRQMTVLQSDDSPDMVFGNVSHFYSPELEQSIREKVVCPTENMPGYNAGTLLIRRETFLYVGLFNPAFQCGEFIDWSFRARDKGLKELLLPDVLLKRRIHSSNMGILKRNTQTENTHADYIRVLKASLDRRRNKHDESLITKDGDFI